MRNEFKVHPNAHRLGLITKSAKVIDYLRLGERARFKVPQSNDVLESERGTYLKGLLSRAIKHISDPGRRVGRITLRQPTTEPVKEIEHQATIPGSREHFTSRHTGLLIAPKDVVGNREFVETSGRRNPNLLGEGIPSHHARPENPGDRVIAHGARMFISLLRILYLFARLVDRRISSERRT